jgi:hypothetical protein
MAGILKEWGWRCRERVLQLEVENDELRDHLRNKQLIIDDLLAAIARLTKASLQEEQKQ